mmetsp:Transcript_1746/g.3698  ORF Transcript_1746/g.3698 Transcript_1746/m.3698 type:complete len:101 (-) Transcript_1746:7-309(-)
MAFNCVFDFVDDCGTKASLREASAKAMKKIVVFVENLFIVVSLLMKLRRRENRLFEREATVGCVGFLFHLEILYARESCSLHCSGEGRRPVTKVAMVMML